MRFGLVRSDGTWVYWSEQRPEEAGRGVIMRKNLQGECQEILPAPYSARSRVHEYGGGEFTPTPDGIIFVNAENQDIYRIRLGNQPQRLTNIPEIRFADIAVDQARNRIICVAERFEDKNWNGHPQNFLSYVKLDVEQQTQVSPLVEGHDFYAAPSVSPNGNQLAWMSWNLPDMPWDSAALYIADIDNEGKLGPAKTHRRRRKRVSLPT